MCNHCHSHEAVEKFKIESRNVFLSSLAETSSQVSEMDVGILAKDVQGSTKVVTFGTMPEILDMANKTYMSILKVALEKAKEEHNLGIVSDLYEQAAISALQINSFVTELDKITDAFKEALKGGK